ncbi:MAG: hypothetical protein OCC49_13745 [Fibrobacterales bacterium]
MKMLKQMMISVVLIASVFAGNSFAGNLKQCPNLQIDHLISYGDRDDLPHGPDVSNKIALIPKTSCYGVDVLYLSLSDISYSAMLTMLMSAKNSARSITISYDEDSGLPTLPTWKLIKVITD